MHPTKMHQAQCNTMCTYTCIYICISNCSYTSVYIYIHCQTQTLMLNRMACVMPSFTMYIYIQRVTQHVFESKDLGRESKPREPTYMHVNSHQRFIFIYIYMIYIYIQIISQTRVYIYIYIHVDIHIYIYSLM